MEFLLLSFIEDFEMFDEMICELVCFFFVLFSLLKNLERSAMRRNTKIFKLLATSIALFSTSDIMKK